MSLLFDLCQRLYDTPLATSIRESEIAFPAIETIHVLGLALMTGTIAIVDLRLLGWVFHDEPVSDLADQLLPATWVGFAVMAASGLTLFAAEAAKIYANPALCLKAILLVLAGLNMLAFHFGVYRHVADWGQEPRSPGRARAAAGLSLVLWAGVIASGRMIAYFHAPAP
jgi:hypothetical protein